MHIQLEKAYQALLEQEWQGVPLWKRIADGELTCAPHFEGTGYQTSDARLMVVGRAMNGWEQLFTNCSSAADLLSAILAQPNPLDDVVKREGIKSIETKGTYFYKRSGFWTLIKFLLNEYGEAEPGKWYDDETYGWNQRILWSNLYKVSSRLTGEIEWPAIKPSMSYYIKIIQQEIAMYEPKHILFVTDMNYFVPWKKQPSFKELLADFEAVDNGSCIVGKGWCDGAKALICKRPDRRGTSHLEIARMAREVKAAFNCP